MRDRNLALKNVDETLHTARRLEMVEALRSTIHDANVLAAMERVPRHVFVPEPLRDSAYEDRVLPIGQGQTISRPLMVAVMLQTAELRGDERVLDVGAGSGYQTALLSELVERVYAVEILPDLVARARAALRHVGAMDVTLVRGDGTRGYAPGAPYDAIFVAAATREIPDALVDQLSDRGRLLIPIGTERSQTLARIRKCGGALEGELLDPCSFVPLIAAQTRPP